MGPTSSLTPEKTSLGFMKKIMTWVLFWRRSKNGRRNYAKTAVSRERTALISFDDLSMFNESSHCFKSSQSSDSNSTPSPPLMPLESLAPWHEGKGVRSLRSNELDEIETDGSLKQNARMRRSLLYAFHNARLKSLIQPEKDDNDGGDDDQSEHFSISTDLRYHQPFLQQVKINIITAGTEASPTDLSKTLAPPSENSSVQTSRSAHSAPSSVSARENKSRISLDQFLEEQTQTSSLMTGPVYLNTIRADDAASVGSASLDVMFKGEYPQLVLTPSKDGTASKMTASSFGSHKGTAVTFTSRRSTSSDCVPKKGRAVVPSSRSVSSFDSTKRTISCTPQWLNDNIDRVWRQLDHCKSDPEGRYAPDDDPYEESDEPVPIEPNVEVNVFRYQFKNGKMTEVGAGDDDDTANDSVLQEAGNTTDDDLDAILDGSDDEPVGTNENFQEEKSEVLSFRSFSPFDDMGWSFVAESGARSISNMIEKEVIYPILKPICELVEATEIPEIPERRPWKTSVPHRNPSSYRMSPRRPKSRIATNM